MPRKMPTTPPPRARYFIVGATRAFHERWLYSRDFSAEGLKSFNDELVKSFPPAAAPAHRAASGTSKARLK